MSLAKRISENSKEIAGSRTKNRLTVQISYAMQLIIEFYSMDYIVLMDYIEDVAIIDNPNSPSSIHMYQVKTKSSDKQYSLTTVISDKWFQKLYKEIAANRGDVKVIDVTGKVNHIMDENDYKLIEDQISEIITRF